MVRAARRSPDASAGSGLRSRGLGPLRAGRRPVRHRRGDRPVRRAARRDVPRPRRPRRRRRRPQRRPCRPPSARARCASAEVNRILGTSLAADDLPPLLDPIGFTRVRRRRRADGGHPVVAARQRRGDRRHRGGRPPLRLRPHRQGGARVDVARPAVRAPSSAGASCATVLLGLGITEAMPNPFLAPDTLVAGRPRRRRAAHHQPARRRGERAAHLAAAGPAAGRRASTSRTAARAWRCSRSATSTRPGRASCPTSTRRSASCSPARRRRRRWRCGGRSPRRWASAPASTRAACRPGCTRPARRRSSPGATPSAPSARWRPRCSPAFGIAERVAVARARPAPRARPRAEAGRGGSRRAGTRRATSTWPSRCPTTCRPRSSTRRSARAPAACSSTSSCSTSTAAPAWATAGAAWPTACGSRRPTAPSPTPTSPRSGQRVDGGGGQARCRAARPGPRRRWSRSRADGGRAGPGWVWVVVPMVLSALLFGALAVAVRSSGEETTSISGPPGSCRLSSPRPTTCWGRSRPRRRRQRAGPGYGEVTLGFERIVEDDHDFAAEFDRLPDAEARLLGRTLGAIQAELSPTALGGARTTTTVPPTSCSRCACPGRRSRPSTPTGRPRPGPGHPAVLDPGPDGLRRAGGDVRHRRPDGLAARIDGALRTTARPGSSARWPTRSASGCRPSTTSTTRPSSWPVRRRQHVSNLLRGRHRLGRYRSSVDGQVGRMRRQAPADRQGSERVTRPSIGLQVVGGGGQP